MIHTEVQCRECEAGTINAGFVTPARGTNFTASCYTGFVPTKEGWTCDEPPAECVRPCGEVEVERGNLTAKRWPPLPGDTVTIARCERGYQETGFSSATCLPPSTPGAEPQYHRPLGSCKPVYCPQLFVVDGAVLPEGRPRAGQKVFVNCEIGNS